MKGLAKTVNEVRGRNLSSNGQGPFQHASLKGVVCFDCSCVGREPDSSIMGITLAR